MTIQPDLDSKNSVNLGDLMINISVPGSMELAELKDLKFVEVRGTVEGLKEITLKEYTNFKETFGIF